MSEEYPVPIPLIVCTANSNRELDYCNQRWETYTGLTAEETKGRGWEVVVHPDDLQRCIDKGTRAFSTGEPYEIEYRFKRADGTYRWHLGWAILFKKASGAIIKWLGTGTDIDDQIRAKEQLHQTVIDVEKVVAARTELASLNQMRVQQNEARKAAVEVLQHDSLRLNEIITTQYKTGRGGEEFPVELTIRALCSIRMGMSSAHFYETLPSAKILSGNYFISHKIIANSQRPIEVF